MIHAPRIIPQLNYQDLTTPTLCKAMHENMQEDYYWSEDFSPEFYIAQARAGFMAVTETHKGEEVLLPELQRSYALLDFSDLHTSRKAQRILARDHPLIHVGFSLRTAYQHIRLHHKHSWITLRYLDILERVNEQKQDLKVVSVLLRHKGHVTAGEIGYILGRTYTSLSGFSSRDPNFRDHGTVQLVMLSRWLEQHGFAFWNLGQPYMPYKFALGAKEYSRHSFLLRWETASCQTLPNMVS